MLGSHLDRDGGARYKCRATTTTLDDTNKHTNTLFTHYVSLGITMEDTDGYHASPSIKAEVVAERPAAMAEGEGQRLALHLVTASPQTQESFQM